MLNKIARINCVVLKNLDCVEFLIVFRFSSVLVYYTCFQVRYQWPSFFVFRSRRLLTGLGTQITGNVGLNTLRFYLELKSLFFFVLWNIASLTQIMWINSTVRICANCRMAFELIKFTVNIQQLHANRSEYVCFSNSFTCEWREHHRIPSIF